MFIGHYGAGFAIRAKTPKVPLWILFIAVQLVDVGWGIFVLTGIEKVRIVPGITKTNPLDLYYMPYTHSLLGSLVWALVAMGAWGLWMRGKQWASATLVGLAVFSHWPLDLIVHRPDLPLYDDTLKMGLGLWNFPVISFGLEIALLAGGMTWYLRSIGAVGIAKTWPMWAFVVVLIGSQSTVFFGAPPETPAQAAVLALVSYAMFSLVALWLEKVMLRRVEAG